MHGPTCSINPTHGSLDGGGWKLRESIFGGVGANGSM